MKKIILRDKIKKFLGFNVFYNNYFQSPIKIDLGCGPWKKEGFIGIDNYLGKDQWDINDRNKIDINHDLSRGIPFINSSVEEIFAAHFLEHTNIDFMLKEIHRVAKPNANFEFIVPYANSAEGMFPGHNVFLTEKFFDQNTLFNSLFYGKEFKFTPSDEWEKGELQKHTNIPFDIARLHFFNVCKWFTVNCKIKK